MINIIARKPADVTASEEFIVVDRGDAVINGQFVSARANPRSLAGGEWFWGHYFDTRTAALAHFNNR